MYYHWDVVVLGTKLFVVFLRFITNSKQFSRLYDNVLWLMFANNEGFIFVNPLYSNENIIAPPLQTFSNNSIEAC